MVCRFERFSRTEVEAMLEIALQQTRVYREIKEEGREEGRKEATVNLIVRQLTKRFGEVCEEMHRQIFSYPLPILEELSEDLLDFTSKTDIWVWLDEEYFNE